MKERACFMKYLECQRVTGELGEKWSIDIVLIEESSIQVVEPVQSD